MKATQKQFRDDMQKRRDFHRQLANELVRTKKLDRKTSNRLKREARV